MQERQHADRVVVVTGPVGAGKSTVAAALSDLLGQAEIPHGMIDVDYVRWCYPTPANDRFHAKLGRRNMAAVAANYRAAGAKVIVLADVVEDMAQRGEYEAAIPDAEVSIVRLRVPLDVIERRLRTRMAQDSAESLEWHLRRAPELEAIMDERGIGDLVVDAGEQGPAAIAGEIAQKLELISS
ncbi:MAG: AAA family ATPase [Thermomicrobiales bacterium]